PRGGGARRWARRDRSLVTAAAAAVLVALVGLAGVLTVQARANADLRVANDRVQARFDLAMDAVKAFYTGVSEDVLLKRPEFDELRTRLLRSAREFYRRLEDLLRGQTDPRSRAALGRAYFAVGHLTAAIGSKEEALA